MDFSMPSGAAEADRQNRLHGPGRASATIPRDDLDRITEARRR
jgi:hypothetical protein